ncbi:biotin--protein ligase [Desulfocucumis palustris]|uniref:Bifunctional ligase/repressor BirA n=1 Tax=Desulfocucumis palustris TaxID=1898651 RepID=A0A2L2XCU5_9FIRM|nr:biotin--[acetyl-CoA-carboxylase] ligase [Desulfocucumis palustris]GBF32046.1 biotin--protein ligase [Desulfocucumis palustris]
MKNAVLRLLRENSPGYISGEEICKRMGVSRTAIWKHIQALRAEGYDIDSQTHSGYRLVAVPDRLYPEEIYCGLESVILGRNVYYFDSTASTNQAAREIAAGGGAEGTLVVAEEQTGGRGRMGRGWYAPRYLGIFCSLILRPELPPTEAPPVTMLAAVALARAIQEVCHIKAGIKWPNDILIGGKKLCGILTEMSAEMERLNYLVVGMGVNVNTADFPGELKEIATSLKIETGAFVSRRLLLQRLLYQFEQLYRVWLDKGFKPVLAEWKEYCVTLNCPVRVTSVRETLEGWAEDVDDTGALLLRLPDGTLKQLVAGEVSLRTQ